ncbi:MAG: MMPL family transporter [Spirochaetales bacterium]|nr:MMPL family transporter [Spirochaetales bacterium]
MMKKIISNTIKHANFIIIVILLITVVMGVLASGVVFNPDYYNIYPDKNERSEVLLEETGISEELDMYLMVSVKSDDALSIRKLEVFFDVLQELEAHPAVSDCISPFDFITFRNEAGRLSVERMVSHPPRNEEELADFRERLLSEPLAQNTVVSDMGKTLTAFLINTSIDDPAGFMMEFERIIEPLLAEFEVLYTGDAPFSYHTAEYLQRDLLVLVVLAFLVILIVLYFSFRAFRAVFLPLITVGIGALWAIGFSTAIGYDLTIVSIILPIIILAIGSSYTVHILSEYFRSYNVEDGVSGIAEAVSHVVLTVILAGVTTMIGFSSLLFTSIGPLKEFGLSVSFGILTCVILSIFFLPALLSKLSPPRKVHKEKIHKDFITKIVVKLGEIVDRRYLLLFVGFFVIVISAFFLYPEISRKVDYIDYFPGEDKIVLDTYEMLEDSGGSQALNITLKAPDGTENYFIRDDVIKKILLMQEAFSEDINVIGLTSYYTILKQINKVMTGEDEFPEKKGLILLLSRYFKLLGEGGKDITYGSQADFINDDYSQVTLFIKVFDGETGKIIAAEDTLSLLENFKGIVGEFIPEVSEVYYWGNTMINYDAAAQIQKDQLFSSFLSMVLIFAVSSIFFRSFRLGSVSLIPLVAAIAFNYIIMVVFKIPLDVTTVLVSNVAIGVGVDDAIHFILQYQKQLVVTKQDCRAAISKTFLITGRPIVLTTISIVAGFMVLGFASFKPIVFFGILVSISLFAAMFATLIFLPAFIIVIDKLGRRVISKKL